MGIFKRTPYAGFLKSFRGETGLYAAWEPNRQKIELGTIGHFEKDGRFVFAEGNTLARLGLTPAWKEDAIRDTMHLAEKAWSVVPEGGLAFTLPHIPPISVGGNVTLRTERSSAWALLARDAYEAYFTDEIALCEEIRKLVLGGNGKWRIDDVVVTKRIKADDGFAAVIQGRRKELRLKLHAAAKVSTASDLANASLQGGGGSSTSSQHRYEFSDVRREGGRVPTPIFATPVGIRRENWHKLLRLKKRGRELYDGGNNVYSLSDPPVNLGHLPEEERYYQPGAEGVLSPEAVAAMPIWELFGPVDAVFEDPWTIARRLVLNTLGSAVRIWSASRHSSPDEGAAVSSASSEEREPPPPVSSGR